MSRYGFDNNFARFDYIRPVETAVVPAERKRDATTRTRAFMMAKEQAELESILHPEMLDASAEIEFCRRYLSGELLKTHSLAAYGIVTAGGEQAVEDRAIYLLPFYYDWKDRMRRTSPVSMKIVDYIVMEGLGIRRAATKAGVIAMRGESFAAKSAKHILHGLNEYCKIRGWGDFGGMDYIPYNGFVYVIGSEDRKPPFKVGQSLDPRRRLKDLQVASPQTLKLHYVAHTRVHQQAAEMNIHEALKSHRVRGEWFDTELGHIVDVVRIIYPDCVDAEIC